MFESKASDEGREMLGLFLASHCGSLQFLLPSLKAADLGLGARILFQNKV